MDGWMDGWPNEGPHPQHLLPAALQARLLAWAQCCAHCLAYLHVCLCKRVANLHVWMITVHQQQHYTQQYQALLYMALWKTD